MVFECWLIKTQVYQSEYRWTRLNKTYKIYTIEIVRLGRSKQIDTDQYGGNEKCIFSSSYHYCALYKFAPLRAYATRWAIRKIDGMRTLQSMGRPYSFSFRVLTTAVAAAVIRQRRRYINRFATEKYATKKKIKIKIKVIKSFCATGDLYDISLYFKRLMTRERQMDASTEKDILCNVYVYLYIYLLKTNERKRNKEDVSFLSDSFGRRGDPSRVVFHIIIIIITD